MPDVFIVPMIAGAFGITVAIIAAWKDFRIQKKKRAEELEADEAAARWAFQQAALTESAQLRRELFEELRSLKHRDAVQQTQLDAALDSRRELGKRVGLLTEALEGAQAEAEALRKKLEESQKREHRLSVELLEVRRAIGLGPSIPPPKRGRPT